MFVQLVTLYLVLCAAGSFQSVAAACKAGWLRYRNHCYLFGSSRVTWSHGQSHCESRGGNLASIVDRHEHNFVVSRVRGDAWIGLVEIGGVWRWFDGTAFAYSYWAPGEPNNYKGQCEDCGELQAWTHGKWNDGKCATYKYYVCKMANK